MNPGGKSKSKIWLDKLKDKVRVTVNLLIVPVGLLAIWQLLASNGILLEVIYGWRTNWHISKFRDKFQTTFKKVF